MNDPLPKPRLTWAEINDPDYRARAEVRLPDAHLAKLPEQILQFGTGRFLRGFVGYFVHRANQAGVFDGTIVCVQSTGGERASILNEQDGLYTLWTRGTQEGQPVELVMETVDVSYAEEWKFDHGIAVPLHFLTPRFDLPIIPAGGGACVRISPARVQAARSAHWGSSAFRWPWRAGPGPTS